MDSQKRLMLALALSFVVVTAWTLLFGPKPGPATQLGGADAGAMASPAPAPVPAPASPLAATADAGEPPAPLVEVPREFSKIHDRLTSDGAGLNRAELQGPKMRENEHWGVV